MAVSVRTQTMARTEAKNNQNQAGESRTSNGTLISEIFKKMDAEYQKNLESKKVMLVQPMRTCRFPHSHHPQQRQFAIVSVLSAFLIHKKIDVLGKNICEAIIKYFEAKKIFMTLCRAYEVYDAIREAYQCRVRTSDNWDEDFCFDCDLQTGVVQSIFSNITQKVNEEKLNADRVADIRQNMYDDSFERKSITPQTQKRAPRPSSIPHCVKGEIIEEKSGYKNVCINGRWVSIRDSGHETLISKTDKFIASFPLAVREKFDALTPSEKDLFFCRFKANEPFNSAVAQKLPSSIVRVCKFVLERGSTTSSSNWTDTYDTLENLASQPPAMDDMDYESQDSLDSPQPLCDFENFATSSKMDSSTDCKEITHITSRETMTDDQMMLFEQINQFD
jgi:hypothetical protein